MAKITYTNKVALNENPEIADINKVKDTDMNEIKTVVNGLDDNIGTLSNLTTTNKTSTVAAINELNSNKASTNEVLIQNTEPTAADNKIWIDTGEIASPVSEITNSYSTSTGIGYSANYVNNNLCYKKLVTTSVNADSNGIITQNIENYTNYDFLLIEYSSSTTNAIQTILLPTFTINSTKHFYPTLFQASNVYESIIITFPTTTQIKLEVDTNAGWGKSSLTLYTITGIKMNSLN